jgi:multidrug resistance protein
MKQRSPLLFIFLTVFIDLLGIGILIPLLPYYVKIVEQSANPLLADNRALIVGLLTASYALMQFLFAPVLGALSDRFGRRPVLLWGLVGTGVSYLFFAFSDRFAIFGVEAVLAVLFAARILSGIASATISTAQAYIADVTEPEERAKGMGLIGAAFGLGFMLGPALGGFLSTINLEAPALAAAAIALLNAAFGFRMLPESLPVERRAALAGKSLNPITRLRGVMDRESIRPLLVGVLLLNFAFAGLQSNFAVYTDVRFGFGPSDNALVFAFIGLIAVIVQGFLIRKLAPRFGEERLALAGLALMTLSFALVPLVSRAWMLYPAVALLAIGSGMATPSLTSLISRRVSPREQGTTLGGVQALNSLMLVVGPIYAGLTFDAVSISAPYFSGVLCIATGMFVLGRALAPQLGRREALEPPVPALELKQPAPVGSKRT